MTCLKICICALYSTDVAPRVLSERSTASTACLQLTPSGAVHSHSLCIHTKTKITLTRSQCLQPGCLGDAARTGRHFAKRLLRRAQTGKVHSQKQAGCVRRSRRRRCQPRRLGASPNWAKVRSCPETALSCYLAVKRAQASSAALPTDWQLAFFALMSFCCRCAAFRVHHMRVRSRCRVTQWAVLHLAGQPGCDVTCTWCSCTRLFRRTLVRTKPHSLAKLLTPHLCRQSVHDS